MKTIKLDIRKLLHGYDMVSKLYPFIPSMNLWRSWEYTVYQRYKLSEPVLDVGCGDGGFFRLVWPKIRHVSGIDVNEDIVDIARSKGIYENLVAAPAGNLPFSNQLFSSVFSNCALEHMDNIDNVLAEIFRVLKPGGRFIFSAVTEKFIEWQTFPLLLECLGDMAKAESLRQKYLDYHHLRNPFSCKEWMHRLNIAGFNVLECVPIAPEMTSRFFLFLDFLWHISRDGKVELGSPLQKYLEKYANFPNAMRDIYKGILKIENDWTVTSGLALLSSKPN